MIFRLLKSEYISRLVFPQKRAVGSLTSLRVVLFDVGFVTRTQRNVDLVAVRVRVRTGRVADLGAALKNRVQRVLDETQRKMNE